MKTLRILVSIMMVASLLLAGFAIAEEEGDIYYFQPAGWPDRHWAFMTSEQIAAYEAAGWVRYTGTLWYDSENHHIEFVDININDIPQLYNDGLWMAVLYSWVHDGPSLGKKTQQNVSVGYWHVTAEQATEYIKTYVQPELPQLPQYPNAFGYYSYWYLDGQEAAEPESLDQKGYNFVRYEHNVYKLGYGQEIVLLNGEVLVYTLDEAVKLGGVDDELWPLI